MTGGARGQPLAVDGSGIWFYGRDYRDAYTDLNATFVTPRAAKSPGPPGRMRRQKRRKVASSVGRVKKVATIHATVVMATAMTSFSQLARSEHET